MQVIILIPAYQPSRNIVTYVKQLKKSMDCNIVVVNDGSDHSFHKVFEALSLYCMVLQHTENQGKGASLRHGFTYISKHYPNCNGVLTVDADGQHAIEDVINICQEVEKNDHHVIFGVRDFYSKTVPWKNKFGNRLTSFLCQLRYHRKISDTQTGLRFYPSSILPELLMIEGDRYEYEFRVLIHFFETKKKILEFPIATIYLEEQTPSHFHRVKDSYRIYKLFFKRRKL